MGDLTILREVAERATKAFKALKLKIDLYNNSREWSWAYACDKLTEAEEALIRVLGEDFKTFAECLQELQQIAAEFYIDDRTMTPREYGAKLRDRRERFHKHDSYRYIPQARRNLPYMRRNC